MRSDKKLFSGFLSRENSRPYGVPIDVARNLQLVFSAKLAQPNYWLEVALRSRRREEASRGVGLEEVEPARNR
jgi:hypothetical protein